MPEKQLHDNPFPDGTAESCAWEDGRASGYLDWDVERLQRENERLTSEVKRLRQAQVQIYDGYIMAEHAHEMSPRRTCTVCGLPKWLYPGEIARCCEGSCYTARASMLPKTKPCPGGYTDCDGRHDNHPCMGNFPESTHIVAEDDPEGVFRKGDIVTERQRAGFNIPVVPEHRPQPKWTECPCGYGGTVRYKDGPLQCTGCLRVLEPVPESTYPHPLDGKPCPTCGVTMSDQEWLHHVCSRRRSPAYPPIPHLVTFAETVIDEAKARPDEQVWQLLARMATNALAATESSQQALDSREGYERFGCPKCGDVYQLPAEPDEPAPWCCHNGYKWPHFASYNPERWAEMGWTPMVRVKVTPL